MISVVDAWIEKKSIPPVILLTGSRETANLLSAKELAKKLLGSKHASKIDQNNHPDLHIYETEGKNGMHSIASMHQLLREIALTPFEADFKVFIIDQAERMLPSSSNALLKTLEEPPPDSYLILVSNAPDQLLPTVISRCRKVFLENLSIAPSPPFRESALCMIGHASQENYDLLIEEITTLEQNHFSEDPGSSKWRRDLLSLFEALLITFRDLSDHKGMPTLETVAEGIEAASLGIEHHIKLRALLLHFFLKIFK